MADWSRNNAACRTTWLTLRVLDQTRKVFDDAGAVRMQDLGFWNPAATDALRRGAARALARQLDNVFTMIRGAKYENGKTSTAAVNAMVDVLVDGNKTIADLAAANDASYHFRMEP
ncbi:MAG: hypothetical protein ACOY71_13935 [Gemmatimonadota bacterium]